MCICDDLFSRSKETSLFLLLLDDALDDLLLLDEESTDDAVADARGAAGATISTVHGLLALRDAREHTGTQGLDLYINGN